MRKKNHHTLAWLILLLCISTISFAQPAANFTASITEGCSPLKVQFTDLSTGAPTSWSWDFGNGQSSTAQNPLVTYAAPGIYSVSLTVQNATGSDVEQKLNYIIVDTVPQALFTSKIAGCIPLVDTFTDQSIAGAGTISAWSWSFGDGGTSTVQNPVYTYAAGGTYTVSLTVQNSKGCRDTLVVDTLIHTGTKPTAAFTYPVLYTCASDPVRFNNNSTGTVTSWLWTFGDGDSSTKENPLHYFQDTGYLKIILRAINNGCVDSFQTKNLYVKPPIVKFRYYYSCSDPYTISFQAKYLGATSFYWDFGDGSPRSTDEQPVHTFPDTSSYSVILFATGPECTYQDSAVIPIIHEQPSIISNKASLCKLDTVKFAAANYNPSHLVSFEWNFGDGVSVFDSTVSTSSHSYAKAGNYPVSLIVQDILGCYDTTTNNTNVYGPTAAFTNIAQACIKNPLTFTDQSTTDGTHAITKWTWDFGDGSVNTFNAPPFTHTYTRSDTFSIKLRVTDSFGCADTVSHTDALVTIPKPVSSFSVSDTLNCFSDSVLFADKSQGSALGRTWNFGDGTTSSIAAPSHTYAATGNYVVTLVIGTEVGCSDTSSQGVKVLPLPAIDAGKDSIICFGQSIGLQATGGTSYTWSADPSLSCFSCANPVAAPATNTIYRLHGTDSFGCSAPDSIFVEVKQPITLSLASMDTVCLGNSVQLNASGAEIYSWQPQDGLNNPTIANPVATPTTGGNITYRVVGTDSKNCFADTASVNLIVATYPQFNIIDTNVTIASGGIYVIRTTSSPDVIRWQWSPATDLSCVDCPEPVAKGNKIIQYTGIATNAYGCSVADKILVRGLCNSEVIFIPNTFSPNGDHVNDYFYPRGQGLYLIKSMRIFNRLGQLVFEKVNFSPDIESQGWNGTFKSKKLPSDVYVYFIEVMCNNGVVVPIKGNITLIY